MADTIVHPHGRAYIRVCHGHTSAIRRDQQHRHTMLETPGVTDELQ
jgi:hypothetical protein